MAISKDKVFNDAYKNTKRLERKTRSFFRMMYSYDAPLFTRWQTSIERLCRLTTIDKNDDRIHKISLASNNKKEFEQALEKFESIIDSFKNSEIQLKTYSKFDIKNIPKDDKINFILNNFHNVAIELSKRQNNKPSFDIDDEYCMQDLLRAMFKMFYNDVRTEEYKGSAYGANSKIDFVVFDNDVAIECKFITENLLDKKLGEQMLIDKDRYEKERKYKSLIFFVYDPKALLKNPNSLINDFKGLGYDVIIMPKRK